MARTLYFSLFVRDGGADNFLHLRTQGLTDENEAVALYDSIHPLERIEIIAKEDFHADLTGYLKWIPRATAFYKAASDL